MGSASEAAAAEPRKKVRRAGEEENRGDYAEAIDQGGNSSPRFGTRFLSRCFDRVRVSWWNLGLLTLLAGACFGPEMTYPLFAACRLVLGTLYPAYASYKAVRTKNVREYVKWMMYWIVFALFGAFETFADVFVAFWFPFYYELKIILLLWLISPVSRGSLGSSMLYRKVVHPNLIKREEDIDRMISMIQEQSYNTALRFGSRAFHYVTNAVMQTAIRGGGGLVHQLKKSYSLTDLSGAGADGGDVDNADFGRPRAIGYDEQDSGRSFFNAYGSPDPSGVRERRNRSVEVPDQDDRVFTNHGRRRQQQMGSVASLQQSPPPPSSGYSSGAEFLPVGTDDDEDDSDLTMNTDDYELYNPRTMGLRKGGVGGGVRGTPSYQRTASTSSSSSSSAPFFPNQSPIRAAGAKKKDRRENQFSASEQEGVFQDMDMYNRQRQQQQQQHRHRGRQQQQRRAPPPTQHWSRTSSASTIADSYYPSEVETEYSEIQDEEEDTWSDTLEEPVQGDGGAVTSGPSLREIYSDEEEDGEKTPVGKDERVFEAPDPKELAGKLVNLAAATAVVSSGRAFQQQRSESLQRPPQPPSREEDLMPHPADAMAAVAGGGAMSMSTRPRSVCTGSELARKAAPAPPKRTSPKPAPPPIFRKVGGSSDMAQVFERDPPATSTSRPKSPSTSRPTSPSPFLERPPSRGQTAFPDEEEEGLQFPSVSASRESSATRVEKRPSSRPSSRLGGPHDDEEGDGASPLSASPSRCPHCTIHSWLPHSHSCPKWKGGGAAGNGGGGGGGGGGGVHKRK